MARAARIAVASCTCGSGSLIRLVSSFGLIAMKSSVSQASLRYAFPRQGQRVPAPGRGLQSLVVCLAEEESAHGAVGLGHPTRARDGDTGGSWDLHVFLID